MRKHIIGNKIIISIAGIHNDIHAYFLLKIMVHGDFEGNMITNPINNKLFVIVK